MIYGDYSLATSSFGIISVDRLYVTAAFSFPTKSSAPTPDSTGSSYFNVTDNKFYIYSGTSWVTASGTSGTSGTNGSSGTSGLAGSSGTSGTSGAGSSGTSGTSGVGSSGTSGTSGVTGGTVVLLSVTEIENNGTTTNGNVVNYIIPSNSYSYLMAECEVYLAAANQITNDSNMTFNLIVTGSSTIKSLTLKTPRTGTASQTSIAGTLKSTFKLQVGGDVSASVSVTTGNNATWGVQSFRVYGIL